MAMHLSPGSFKQDTKFLFPPFSLLFFLRPFNFHLCLSFFPSSLHPNSLLQSPLLHSLPFSDIFPISLFFYLILFSFSLYI